MVDSTAAKETSANTSYTGKGGPAKMDINGTMAVLTAQNANIKKMLDSTKKSVSELLSEVEGSGGGMASFPDKWPTDGGTISSNYGVRTGPIEGGYDWHPGLDIAVDFGAPVYATLPVRLNRPAGTVATDVMCVSIMVMAMKRPMGI